VDNLDTYQSSDEITLKELLLKLYDFYLEVVRNWKIILLFIAIFVSYFAYRAITAKETFAAGVTFMINEESSAGATSAGSILSSYFGGGNHNLYKTVELSKTFKVIEPVLMMKEVVNKKDDFFANHLIHDLKLHEQWADDTTGLKNFVYKHNDVTKFNRIEKSVLKMLYGTLIGDTENGVEGMMTNSISDVTSIMGLNMKTHSEDLSIKMIIKIYEELSSFYITQSTEKQKKTYETLKLKADSLGQIVSSLQGQVLRFEDSHKNIVRRSEETRKYNIRRRLETNQLVFGEIKKNLEISHFALQNATPYIQVVDYPFAPIRGSKRSLFRSVIIGIAIGTFLGVVFILVRYFYRSLQLFTTDESEKEPLLEAQNT